MTQGRVVFWIILVVIWIAITALFNSQAALDTTPWVQRVDSNIIQRWPGTEEYSKTVYNPEVFCLVTYAEGREISVVQVTAHVKSGKDVGKMHSSGRIVNRETGERHSVQKNELFMKYCSGTYRGLPRNIARVLE